MEEAEGPIKYTQINSYNYNGQRISKSDNGMITNYYYQGGVLLYTTDSKGNKTSQNIIGAQESVIATIRYSDEGQHVYFYNKDIRTSVTNVVDEAGSGVVSYQYDDYGNTKKYGSEEFYNEVCYTSGVYDEPTGLYYLNARYYNPESATFLTQDSYRGEKNDYGTWNLYAYCGENPINYVDPSGHFVVAIPMYYVGSAVLSLTVSVVVTKDLYNVVTRKKEKRYKEKIAKARSKIETKGKTKSNDKNQLKARGRNIATSKSFKLKGNKGRIYVEYLSDPPIHYHGPDGRKYLIYSTGKIIEKEGRKIVKTIRKIINSKEFHDVLSKATVFLKEVQRWK